MIEMDNNWKTPKTCSNVRQSGTLFCALLHAGHRWTLSPHQPPLYRAPLSDETGDGCVKSPTFILSPI